MKSYYHALCVAFAVMAVFSDNATADKINLKNGSALKGEVTSTGNDSVTIETGWGKQIVPKNEIMSVEYEKGEHSKLQVEENSKLESKEDKLVEGSDYASKLHHTAYGLLAVRTLTDKIVSAYQVQNQGLVGINYSVWYGNWPTILVAYSVSSAQSNAWYYSASTGYQTGTLQLTMSELDLGICYYFFAGKVFMPYVSAGVGFVTVTEKISCTTGCSGTSSDSDSATGLFFNPGAMWKFPFGLSLGVDLKVLSGATMQKWKGMTSADYGQVGFIAGWTW